MASFSFLRPWAAAFAALAASGCLIDLPPPLTDGGDATGGAQGGAATGGGDGGGTGGGVTGGGGASTGGGGTGGGATGGGSDGCEVCDPAHGTGHCEGDECVIDECDDDWVDCDGTAENGCEAHFGGEDVAGDELVALHVGNDVAIDGTFDDWAALPQYPIEETCVGCTNSMGMPSVPVSDPFAPPASDDLTARFRVAWNDTFLFVLLEVRDDAIDGVGGSNPSQRDGMELLLDLTWAEDDSSNPNTMHQLVTPASGTRIFRYDGAELPESQFLASTEQQASCYFTEARFLWSGLNGARPDQLPPEDGRRYRFTVAVNDWEEDARQSMLFWRQAGHEFWFKSNQYGALLLSVEPPSGG